MIKGGWERVGAAASVPLWVLVGFLTGWHAVAIALAEPWTALTLALAVIACLMMAVRCVMIAALGPDETFARRRKRKGW